APDPARGRFRSTPRASTNLRPPDPHLPARYDQSVDSAPHPHRNHSPLDPLSPSAGNGSPPHPRAPPPLAPSPRNGLPVRPGAPPRPAGLPVRPGVRPRPAGSPDRPAVT